MNICICGGGNTGHVIAGFIAAQQRHEVTILTRHPEQWSNHLVVETPDGGELKGQLKAVSSNPGTVIPAADVVLLCLPGFSISEVLLQLRDYLKPSAVVGTVVSSTGFFFEAMKVLPATTTLFGFQRVPFISRIRDYGHRARLMGYKDSLRVAITQTDQPEPLRRTLEEVLQTPVQLLHHYYEASLSNSNPLLHPARLYSLWKDWHEGDTYARVPLFYEEWTVEAAQLYISMDNELQQLLGTLPVSEGCIPSVLDYYESSDAATLAAKLRSIDAFKGILAPMKKVEGGYVPDLNSRYFTEDFPYGLGIIQHLAKEKGVATPAIDRVMEWGDSLINAPHAN